MLGGALDELDDPSLCRQELLQVADGNPEVPEKPRGQPEPLGEEGTSVTERPRGTGTISGGGPFSLAHAPSVSQERAPCAASEL